MKRVIALILALCLLLTACGKTVESEDTETTLPVDDPTTAKEDVPASEESNTAEDLATTPSKLQLDIPEYKNLDDPDLLRYVEDRVYADLIHDLSNDYFVENISTVYISKEYLEEVSYNSQSNVFFGYTLAELNEQFQGTRYIFTLDGAGKTTVQALETYDDTFAKVLKNVAIGSGVILICITASAISGGAGAPAMSMIFAMSAKTGTAMALSTGGVGALASGIVTGIQTQNFDEAVKAAALAGSEGFMLGAISGVIGGGASEAAALKGATLHGLTMDEAALIQREGYPLDVIKEFRSMDQYNVCKEAGLSSQMVNGKTALVRDIDLNYADELGHTNLERMRQGLAALDPATGEAYELHHIGQQADSTLAILTKGEHMRGGNNSIWHKFGEATQVHGAGNTWDAQRQAFWKNFASQLS